MNKLAIRLCLVAALLLLSVPGMAQIDITDYMMLTPGKWKTNQVEDVCEGSTWEEAVTISTNGPYTLEHVYEEEGLVWVKEEIGILEITTLDFKYHGEYNLDPLELGFWLLNPPITIPRDLALNEPAISTGVVTHEVMSFPYVHNFIIIEEGVSITTPAGTFNNCLKIIESSIFAHEANAQIMIWAPGVGEVKAWETNVEEDDPNVEFSSDIYVITAYGP